MSNLVSTTHLLNGSPIYTPAAFQAVRDYYETPMQVVVHCDIYGDHSSADTLAMHQWWLQAHRCDPVPRFTQWLSLARARQGSE